MKPLRLGVIAKLLNISVEQLIQAVKFVHLKEAGWEYDKGTPKRLYRIADIKRAYKRQEKVIKNRIKQEKRRKAHEKRG